MALKFPTGASEDQWRQQLLEAGRVGLLESAGGSKHGCEPAVALTLPAVLRAAFTLCGVEASTCPEGCGPMDGLNYSPESENQECSRCGATVDIVAGAFCAVCESSFCGRCHAAHIRSAFAIVG